MCAYTRVKICGVTTARDRDAAVGAGADAVGGIVDVPVETPRELPPDEAAELFAGLPPFVTGVLVTMPETADAALDLLAATGADAIQLHGGPDPALVDAVAAGTDRRVIAATDVTDEDGIRAYDGPADAILIDSTDDAGAGGTGEPHDWPATGTLRKALDAPVILAGGLTPGNVAEAVRAVDPYAVDVATGVEQPGAPGRKDHDAVFRFVEAARTPAGADTEPAADGPEAPSR